jgi:hypothetical protein
MARRMNPERSAGNDEVMMTSILAFARAAFFVPLS